MDLTNFYYCPDCDEAWETPYCDSEHDDECPKCGTDYTSFGSTEGGAEPLFDVTAPGHDPFILYRGNVWPKAWEAIRAAETTTDRVEMRLDGDLIYDEEGRLGPVEDGTPAEPEEGDYVTEDYMTWFEYGTREFAARNPAGGGVTYLCGYGVRRLEGGEWVRDEGDA